MSLQAATKVMRVLQAAGHEAFMVGGCVRDERLGRPAKDFDVATGAVPDEVRALFPHSTPVGAAFGVVVVIEDGHQIEVATFREDSAYSDGRRPDEVRYTLDPRKDVRRRDFTMNGLLMEAQQDEEPNAIMDYVGGCEDIDDKLIRCIGDAGERFTEDKLRMLRAVRFVAQLGFTIEQKTLEAITVRATTITTVSRERVRDEMTKLLQGKYAVEGIKLLVTTGLAQHLFGVSVLTAVNGETLLRFTKGTAFLPMTGNLALAMFAANMTNPAFFLDSLKLATPDYKEIYGAVTYRKMMGEMRDHTTSNKVRLMRLPGATLALEMARQDVVMGISVDDQKLSKLQGFYDVTPEELKLVRFVTGADLMERGMKPDPSFGEILDTMEDMQLNKAFGTRTEALEYLDAVLLPGLPSR